MKLVKLTVKIAVCSTLWRGNFIFSHIEPIICSFPAPEIAETQPPKRATAWVYRISSMLMNFPYFLKS